MIEERLKSLGIVLPSPPKPAAVYTSAKKSSNLIFVSGQLPIVNGKLYAEGRIGKEVELETGKYCARICAINILSVLKEFTGTLDNIRNVVKITGYVASEPDFTDQHIVLNSASEIFHKVFGETGIHSRAAIGVSSLPLNAPVEIEGIFEVRS